ncbi:CoA transferase [Enterovirga sp.]|uniref:CaiB/BaiF CoA transferase family protein n=1 Tax=Enterovirga sp. TaxID=2026350 RepID=UPI002624651A|nr:CoA transferase [Enterovirga sp.]MDB5590614.1 frc 9 [Enterovirga sp.]
MTRSGLPQDAPPPGSSGGCLDGIRILDLTRFYSGPFATLLLAGYGAEVIRIDRPDQGEPAMTGPPFLGRDGVSLERRDADDLGLAYLKRCRGKKSVTLNLETEAGLALFHRLLATADVLVENFRPGVTARLGIDYAANAAVNPRLVHCAITGYGSSGPDRDLKAYDLMVQADSGLMSITGDPEGRPRKAGSALADGISGAFAVSGILAALIEARRSGRGQFVDVAMTDCLVSLVLDEALDCYGDLGLPVRQGNRIMRFSPFDTFATQDGEVTIGVATDGDWRALLQAMERQDLLADPGFMAAGWRVAHAAEVNAVVEAWTRGLTTREVLAVLRQRDIPASPIRGIEDLMSWEHLRARDMVQEVAHPTVTPGRSAAAAGFPVKFSRSRAGYASAAPVLGQDNDEVYGSALGLDAAARERMRADRTI